MIRGLRRANLLWLIFFIALLPMIASADGYLRLNWSLANQAWATVSTGGKNLWSMQSETAKSLDQQTQKRYGIEPSESRASGCVSSPSSGSRTLALADLTLLRTTKNEAEMVKTFGEAYCETLDGRKIWLVGKNQSLSVQFEPLKYRLLEAKK